MRGTLAGVPALLAALLLVGCGLGCEAGTDPPDGGQPGPRDRDGGHWFNPIFSPEKQTDRADERQPPTPYCVPTDERPQSEGPVELAWRQGVWFDPANWYIEEDAFIGARDGVAYARMAEKLWFMRVEDGFPIYAGKYGPVMEIASGAMGPPGLLAFSVTKVWYIQTEDGAPVQGDDAPGMTSTAPGRSDELVVVGRGDGSIRAYDRQVNQVWVQWVPGIPSKVEPLPGSPDVFVGTYRRDEPNRVARVSPTEGILWIRDFTLSARPTLAASGVVLVMGRPSGAPASDGAVNGLDPTRGDTLWRWPHDEPDSPYADIFIDRLAAPLPDGGFLVRGETKPAPGEWLDTYIAVGPDLRSRWEFTAPPFEVPQEGDPDLYMGLSHVGPDGTVYVTTSACKVYAIDPDGTVRWWYRLPHPAWDILEVDGKVLVQLRPDRQALGLEDDAGEWRYLVALEERRP